MKKKLLFFMKNFFQLSKIELNNMHSDSEIKQNWRKIWNLLMSGLNISYFISDSARLNIYSILLIGERINSIYHNIKELEFFQKYPNVSFVALSLCTTSIIILYYV